MRAPRVTNRTSRVEALLRREVADLLVRGDLRDPRLNDRFAISITGVSVSPDLSKARIYVDVLAGGPSIDEVVRGLNAAAGAIRSQLGQRLQMRRIPLLSFERDLSITRGLAIEQVLADLADEAKRSGQPSRREGGRTPAPDGAHAEPFEDEEDPDEGSDEADGEDADGDDADGDDADGDDADGEDADGEDADGDDTDGEDADTDSGREDVER